MVAGRIWPALALLLDFLAESIREERERYEAMGVDPMSDAATFAANIRQGVFNKMRPHLPMPAKAPMSPLHIDLGPYQLKVLHADQGAIPRPKTNARRAFYKRNELGILAMNMQVRGLIEIDEKVTEVEEGSLALVWSSDGPELAQADLYRPTLTGFPGVPLDLLSTSEVVTEDDFSEVRRDDDGSASTGNGGKAATGTTGGSSDALAAGQDGKTTGGQEP